MIDVQSGADIRGIAIPDVGISGYRHLVTTGDEHDAQRVVATLDLGVSLPADRRGTHMSRLVEVVLEHDDDLTLSALPVVAKRLRAHLDADGVRLRVTFPIVVSQDAPVTGGRAANVHDASLAVRVDMDGVHLAVGVEVVATSLCPCSKMISDYGAHNQRSRISVSVEADGHDAVTRLPRLSDLIRWAEAAASSPVYPLLKRPDEREVTMRAFDHPVFVEDVARELALRILELPGPGAYQVNVVNEESIHRHDAYARLFGSIAP